MKKSNLEKSIEAILFVELIIVVIKFVFFMLKILFMLISRTSKFIYVNLLKPLINKCLIYIKRR